MIKINAGGQKFEIRNDWDEITLGELEKIQEILKGEYWVENWRNIIELLSGWPKSQMGDWNTEDFIKLTDHILPLEDVKITSEILTVTQDGRSFVYQPAGMTARVAKSVELAYHNEKYLSLVIATLFREISA